MIETHWIDKIQISYFLKMKKNHQKLPVCSYLQDSGVLFLKDLKIFKFHI